MYMHAPYLCRNAEDIGRLHIPLIHVHVRILHILVVIQSQVLHKGQAQLQVYSLPSLHLRSLLQRPLDLFHYLFVPELNHPLLADLQNAAAYGNTSLTGSRICSHVNKQ